MYANRHSYRISLYWVQNKHTEHDIALNREGYSSYGACWSNQVVHSELAPDNTGSVGPGNGPGIPTPLTNASSIKTSSRGPPVSRSDRPDHNRGRKAETQEGNKPGPSGSRRFCLSTFPGPQEGWRVLPSNKSKSSEHIHPGGAFQDGELLYDKITGETLGMASEGGPKGCILSGPNPPRPPQIPPVLVARSDIPVLLPAIWSVLCSESVHKADETSGGIPEGERNETDNLSGRHAGDQQLPRGGKGICPFNQGSLRFPGADHQRKEITTGTLTGGSIFGVLHFNSDHEHLSAVRKDEKDSARSDALVEGVSVSIWQIAAFIGMANAARQAIPVAPMYHRQLQALINSDTPAGPAPQAMRQSYHNQVELTVESI